MGRQENISIHALRGEGDTTATICCCPRRYFNPRPPWGGRRPRGYDVGYRAEFQSTPSVGRATLGGQSSKGFRFDFNPRPPWGGRPTRSTASRRSCSYFNPRPPWGGRPPKRAFLILLNNFNPRPPWGGRLCLMIFARSPINFNPRPPWGGRLHRPMIFLIFILFQSTPSVGRATIAHFVFSSSSSHFNPRPPWGGRPRPLRRFFRHGSISIHALRGEGDALWLCPTSCQDISIHALRGEGDEKGNSQNRR